MHTFPKKRSCYFTFYAFYSTYYIVQLKRSPQVPVVLPSHYVGVNQQHQFFLEFYEMWWNSEVKLKTLNLDNWFLLRCTHSVHSFQMYINIPFSNTLFTSSKSQFLLCNTSFLHIHFCIFSSISFIVYKSISRKLVSLPQFLQILKLKFFLLLRFSPAICS